MVIQIKKKLKNQKTTVEAPKSERSWTNRLSFGLLDKPEPQPAENTTVAPAVSSTGVSTDTQSDDATQGTSDAAQ